MDVIIAVIVGMAVVAGAVWVLDKIPVDVFMGCAFLLLWILLGATIGILLFEYIGFINLTPRIP